jgi:hypothetical protein
MSAYKVILLTKGCKSCSNGKEFGIEGPDEICLGTSWVGDRDEAEYWCGLLNKAFQEGRDS